jgi:CHAT domain-containing protein/tetratricopeptide (TPR) repeat protein
MTAAEPNELVQLIERKFEQPEDAIAALEGGLATEAQLEHWPLPEDRQITRAKLLLRLCEAYENCRQQDRAENLEKALSASKEALSLPSLRDKDPVLRAQIQRNLGRLFRHRVLGDRSENLESAIAAFEPALEIYTREAFPLDWGRTLANLANVYLYRIQGARADNLEQAIKLYQEALEEHTRAASPYVWALTQYNLAIAYAHRIRGVKAENLERAIVACRAALEGLTRDPYPHLWALTQMNLGNAYLERIGGVRRDNIEEAIQLFEGALEVFTLQDFPYDWVGTQMNLANAYDERICGPKAENIERAIAFHQAALTVRTRADLPDDWAKTQHNLANTYMDRIRGVRADNIEQAIKLYHGALEVYTVAAFPSEWAWTQHDLANAFTHRIYGAKSANLEQAVQHCEALLKVHTRDAFPRDHLKASRLLGQALLDQERWSEASAALAEARSTFLMLLGEGLDEAEAGDLIERAGPLFACAAYAAAELGEPDKGFALSCEGKARLLAGALRLQKLNLPAEQNRQAEILRGKIRELSRTLPLVEGDEHTGLLDELAGLRKELSGLVALSEERTGRRDALAQAQALCADGSVILLPIVTGVGGKLFIIARLPQTKEAALTVLDLTELTAECMQRLLEGEAGEERGGWLAAFSREVSAAERKRRLISSVESIGQELWSLFVRPVETALAELGIRADARLIFLPSAGFGLLPLGLAQEPGSGCRLIEKREIAYAPSLDALERVAAVEQQASLAAIINPTGDLLHAPIEAALVTAHFKDITRLDAKGASSANVLAALKGKSHWHFSTHGTFDLEEARRSALALKGGEALTVGDLIDAEGLGEPRLVALSACETGLHESARMPEEFIGLPGAFLSIGAKAVLGTLWPVNDAAAAHLTARFYELHMGQGLAPSAALRQAQLWLRDATRGAVDACAQRACLEGRLSSEAVRQLGAATSGAAREQLRFFAQSLADNPAGRPPLEGTAEDGGEPSRPFAHPIYWGGFVLTGQ